MAGRGSGNVETAAESDRDCGRGCHRDVGKGGEPDGESATRIPADGNVGPFAGIGDEVGSVIINGHRRVYNFVFGVKTVV